MQANILQEILLNKKEEVHAAEARRPLDDVKRAVIKAPATIGFADALRRSPWHFRSRAFGIIAEIKRASPSKGPIRPDLDPVQTALDFHSAGASCISVLTDEKYFQGSLTFLQQIKAAHPHIPTLRKDFTISNYQVWETRASGADAILLIVSALSEGTLRDLLSESLEAGLDVLIEAHNEDELIFTYETLSLLKDTEQQKRVLLGINNRNLGTFKTDLDISITLLSQLFQLREARGDTFPLLCVSESGIRTSEDIRQLLPVGAQAFLVGESLVTSGSPRENLEKLIQGTLDEKSSYGQKDLSSPT